MSKNSNPMSDFFNINFLTIFLKKNFIKFLFFSFSRNLMILYFSS